MKASTRALLKQLRLSELSEMIFEGSEAAWAYVCEIVHQRALQEAERLGAAFQAGPSDFEDAAQHAVELFLKEGKKMIARSQKRGAWLRLFAYRSVIRYYRQRAALQRSDQGGEQAFSHNEPMETKILARTMTTAISHDAEDQQIIHALQSGMSYRQIAKVLNVTLHQVNQRVQKLRTRATCWSSRRLVPRLSTSTSQSIPERMAA